MPVVVLQLPNVADTVERARPAVVSILSEMVMGDIFGNRRSNFGNGSGVIVDPKGLVLTNNHVIQDAVNVTVTLDNGQQLKADVVGADRLSDLAVLRIPEDNYPFLPLGKDVPLRVGEWVVAIGNALALPGGPTVTVGVISALGRSIDESPEVALYDLIQTDTAINPGNSGGPLLNLRGELIGINTAVLRGGQVGGTPVEGIGFAINMDTAAFVSEQLIRLGYVQWPYMGLSLSDLIPELAAEAGLPIREGVVVQQVFDGPAARAGIRRGDVILSIDGQKVTTASDLTRMLRQNFRVGQEIEVVLFRNRSQQTIRVVLGERPR
jgi:S1-C subfamily serine protease